MFGQNIKVVGVAVAPAVGSMQLPFATFFSGSSQVLPGAVAG